MDLSIVIPVYNEAVKVSRDITDADSFLTRNALSGEIIIVDDGSWDDTVKNVKETGGSITSPLRIIENLHKGKGRAVKTGILGAKSDIIMFIDSGGCVPYDNILAGLDMLKQNLCDIAHGSRHLPESRIRGKSLLRKMFSGAFRSIVTKWMKPPPHLTDTQCGLKIYKREAAITLYQACISDGFMFDIEIILRANKEAYKINEFPIEWTADPDSRLSIVNNIGKIYLELQEIKKTFS